MVCSTARADFPAACAARGGARRTDALARLGALVALLAAWFAQRSPRFALLAPTISLSSLHELGHRSWEVSIIQKGVQRSRNCLDSQRVDLRARPRGGVPRHREEASARRQKIQKTQRDEDPSWRTWVAARGTRKFPDSEFPSVIPRAYVRREQIPEYTAQFLFPLLYSCVAPHVTKQCENNAQICVPQTE